MSKPTATLAKNFSVLLGSQVVTWVLTMVLMIFLPRYLGAANVGKLHLAVALWSIMAVVMAFGADTLTVKEIARDRTKISIFFGTRIVVSSILFVFCMAALLIALVGLDYPRITIYVVLLIGFEYWVWQFISSNEAILQGIEKMEYLSIGRIVGHSVNVAVGVTLLLLGWGLFVIATVRIAAAIIVFLVQYLNLKRLTDLKPRVDTTLAPTLIREGWPYFLSSVSIVFYMHLDVIIMSFLVSEEAIGWYGTADQLFGTLLFIPTAFITSIYPIYAKLSVKDIEPLKALMSKSFDSMLLVSVPIGLGLFLIARPLVLLLYGVGFANSGPVLATFGIVLILTYLNMLVGQFLISIDLQKPWALVMVVATLATIPLDFWLIPWTQAAFGNGALGGALAFILTELGMLSAGLMLLPAQTLGRQNIWSAIKIVSSGLVMVVVTWWFQEQFIAVPIVIGGAIYIGMILLLRVVPKDDIDSLRALFQKAVGRITRRQAPVLSQ